MEEKIKGYEDLYSIDKKGNIYSLPKLIKRKHGNNYITKRKILKPQPNKDNGYMTVQLYKNKKAKRFYVHRLIAETFIENINNYDTVDHIDFDKKNNSVINLQWLPRQKNYQRYIKLGVHYSDGKVVLNKLNGVFHKSISEASRCYNLNRKTLSHKLNNNLIKNLSIV